MDEVSGRGGGRGAAGGTLVVMRHGQSTWTDKRVNRFAGWVDVPLTDAGRERAAASAKLLEAAGIAPEFCFTSLLGRSIETARIVLDGLGRPWVPVRRTWRLNERHYGAFQGQTRPAMLERYGQERFSAYRRSYAVRPPKIDEASEYFQAGDPRYGAVYDDGLGGPDPARIRSECLADVGARLAPYWDAEVAPLLAACRTVLVVTHGSVVRSVIKRLEGVSDEGISAVNVPTGIPRAYRFAPGEGLRPEGPGEYLDPAAAAAGIAAVRDLGKA